jgi:hypothetical protein
MSAILIASILVMTQSCSKEDYSVQSTVVDSSFTISYRTVPGKFVEGSISTDAPNPTNQVSVSLFIKDSKGIVVSQSKVFAPGTEPHGESLYFRMNLLNGASVVDIWVDQQ